jgi:hypothetical protein
MHEQLPMVAPEVVALIERTVRESMSPFGLKSVEVEPGEDHDGDPVIFVEANYDLSGTPIDTEVTARLTSVLRDRLWEAGERRFPHIHHNFDERHDIKPRPKARA